MIKYRFDDSNIFTVTFSETVTKKNILDFLLEFGTLQNLPKELLILYNILDAKINLQMDDLISISQVADKVTSSYKMVRTAFVVDQPTITAYSYLFSHNTSSKNKIRRVFSSDEAAIKWLSSFINLQE